MSKIAFFKVEEWEKEYLGNTGAALGAAPVFIDSVLDASNIPTETDFDIISVFVDSQITKAVLDQFPNLKMIATRSTGFDHIDLDECRARGIVVSTVPSYGEVTVAEYAFALLLTLSRKIYEGYDRIRETGTFSPQGLKGFDLYGKTLGVVGTGKIGKHVIQIANGFGMKVVAFDLYPDQAVADKLGFVYKTLDEVLSESDVVTIHVPYTEDNKHFIAEPQLRQMKKGAYLINTARGPLVKTEDLLKVLKDGHLGGAGLDVLEEEGIIKDEMNFLTTASHPGDVDLRAVIANHILIDLPNVVITPHNAFNTQEALQRILDTTVENINSFSQGQPENVVG